MVLGGQASPSGHTLSTIAFSISAVLCVARIWPRAGTLAIALAVLWTDLLAISRYVLGVHWPSDARAAMCLGAFIPLLISVAKYRRHPSAGARGRLSDGCPPGATQTSLRG